MGSLLILVLILAADNDTFMFAIYNFMHYSLIILIQDRIIEQIIVSNLFLIKFE